MSNCILFIAILCLGVALAQHQLLNYGVKGYPGVHARLNRKFFDLVTKVGADVFDDALVSSRVKLPKIEKQVPGGKITIRDLKFDAYRNNKPYVLEMVPPYTVKIGIADADVTVSSRYDFESGGGLNAIEGLGIPGLGQLGNLVPKKNLGSGRSRTTAKGLSVITHTTLDKTADGRLNLQVTYCETKFRDFNLDINPDAGQQIPIIGGTVGTKFISQAAKPIFEKEICNSVKTMVDGSLNKQLKDGAGMIPLSKLRDFASRQAEEDSEESETAKEFKQLLGSLVEDMMLDMKLTERPLLLGAKPVDWLESKHVGEISYKGRGGTPFYPAAMTPPIMFDRMLEASISDYVVNSLLYQIHQRRRDGSIKIVLNSEIMPSQANMFKTTCQSGICIGDLFEGIQQRHPNKDVEISLGPLDQPYLIAQPGYLQGEISEKIFVFVSSPGSQQKALVMSGNITAKPEARLRVENGKLYGTIELKEMKMPLVIQGRQTNEWTDIFKSMVEDQINEQLKAGVPLPRIKAAQLDNTSVDLLYRTIKLKTDFIVDRAEMSRMVQEALQKVAEKQG